MVSLIVGDDFNGKSFADTSYQLITVSPMPLAAMGLVAPCALSPTSFFDMSQDNGAEIISWMWDFGVEGFNNDTSSLQNPQYEYSQSGEYTIELVTVNENGCSDTTYQDIQVFNTPLAGFTSTLACEGGLTLFSDTSLPAEGEINYWLWSFGNGESSADKNPHQVFADTGNYMVQMIVRDENLCDDTSSQMVRVHPVPLSAFILLDGYENIQGQVLLENISEQAVRYEWDMGNGDTSQAYSPVVRYEENGSYMIQLHGTTWNVRILHLWNTPSSSRDCTCPQDFLL